MKTLKDFNMKSKKLWEVEGVEWREVRLGEVAKEIKSGGTPSRKNKDYWNGTIPWVKIQDIPEQGYVNDTDEKITETGLSNSSAKLLPKGTILFTIFATIGRVGILNIEAATNQAIAGIIPKEGYDRKYLYWVLRKFGKELAQKGRGGAQNNVNLTFLKNLEIPLPFRNGKPDLETQKRIVEYIEVNFSKIDKILEKKKKELEKLDELWESVLEQAFKPKGGEEWREVRLGDLVVEKPKYGLTKKAKDKGSFVLLRITDIDDQGEIKNNNFKFVDLDESEKAKYDIRKGDLLLARSGSVGNFFIAFQDYPNWIYASYLIRFRLDLNKVHLMFVKYFLSSQYFKKWVSFQKRPGVQPNINAKEYSSFKIPIPFRNNQPDLEKQKEIANYLDSVYEKIKTLKEKIQNQITLLEEMKKNILDEVFNIENS